ncbi:MAG: hypothetical protein KKH88_01230 [Nanoarchaeota archaeon]|nr:hypothetical protein [Nanoarchaeota archaeon]
MGRKKVKKTEAKGIRGEVPKKMREILEEFAGLFPDVRINTGSVHSSIQTGILVQGTDSSKGYVRVCCGLNGLSQTLEVYGAPEESLRARAEELTSKYFR